MANLRAYVLAIGGGCGAAAAVTGFATAYPNLPQPKPPA